MPEYRLIVRADSTAMRQVDSFVVAFVRELGIAADEAPRILILLEELLTNLMKYGYAGRAEPGQAEIALGLDGNRLEIEFIDDGCEFDPFSASASNLDEAAENRPIGGIGLHIVRSLADETRYERRNQNNVIRLIRIVASAGIS
ncbi:MAG: ATP-binding protein [Candidatus Binatus sp.]